MVLEYVNQNMNTSKQEILITHTNKEIDAIVTEATLFLVKNMSSSWRWPACLHVATC